MTYKTVRYYKDPKFKKRTIERGLTLQEAQQHCQNPESSSDTCTSYIGRRRTRERGAWFDGYIKE